MPATAIGWEMDVQRGPGWLLVKPTGPSADLADHYPLADELWSLLDRHFIYRLVIELDQVTALVNVPLLRTHNISGMSGCLMNLAFSLVRRPGRYYAKGCTPFVADVLSLPQVRAKTRIWPAPKR